MMRVISSPSISTTGFLTLILAIADDPSHAHMFDRNRGRMTWHGLMARPNRSCKDKTGIFAFEAFAPARDERASACLRFRPGERSELRTVAAAARCARRCS